MRRFVYALIPALLSACQGGVGDSTETTGETDAATGATTTGDPSPTTGEHPATDTLVPTTAADDTSVGDTTVDDTAATTVEVSVGDSETTIGESTIGETTIGEATIGTDTGEPGACEPGDTQDCYSGPPGTAGVGQCAAGSQQCADDRTWGACEGEVLPAQESCDQAGDEDCDGVDPCSGDGEYQWSRVYGGVGIDNGLRVAFDGAGNLVVLSRGQSALDLGGGPLASQGGYDIFVAKYSPAGAHLWSERFGDDEEQLEYAYALAVAPGGDIVIAGDFEGTIDFGGGPLTNQSLSDAFMVKLTGEGEHVWSAAYAAGTYAYPQAVAIDADGNIALGGHFNGSVDLGGGEMQGAGLSDPFVGRFDGDGNYLWSQRFGDDSAQYLYDLDTDAGGNIYVTGGFVGAINPGKGQLVSAGADDVYIAKLSPIGNAVWAKRFGDGGPQLGRGLAVDGQGRVTIVGETQGSVDFGGGPIAGPGLRSFVAQFDGDGAHLWSKLLSEGHAIARAVETDGLGNVVITGYLSGDADFGGGPLVHEGGTDVYLLKLAQSGAHVWSRHFGDHLSQEGFGVAGSSAGAVAFCGGFGGGINFGGGPKISQGTADGFVAVFGP